MTGEPGAVVGEDDEPGRSRGATGTSQSSSHLDTAPEVPFITVTCYMLKTIFSFYLYF